MRIGAMFRGARHEVVRLCCQGEEALSVVLFLGPWGFLCEASKFQADVNANMTGSMFVFVRITQNGQCAQSMRRVPSFDCVPSFGEMHFLVAMKTTTMLAVDNMRVWTQPW